MTTMAEKPKILCKKNGSKKEKQDSLNPNAGSAE